MPEGDALKKITEAGRVPGAKRVWAIAIILFKFYFTGNREKQMNFKEGTKTGKLVFWEDHSDSTGEHMLKSCHFGGTEAI